MPEIKRLPQDSYYRAYREYLDTLKNVGQYEKLKTSLRNSGKKDRDTFSGSIAHKVIDLEWVEQIEAAVPYIDKAIREQRRFISQSDEIVPIEKSKKITTESVRHLAQHTNMIGRVENDTVTPKSILNIVREESFAIYENRFLRTLIMRAIDFVNRCYREVKDTPESTVASISMDRDSFTEGQMFNVTLHCDLEYTEPVREFDVNESVEGLTDFERVIRLRKILSDFLSAPLIMGLAGTPEVRSPVTRTNLLTKDQNFRETLKLWEFLDRYNKVGFSLVIEDNPGRMKQTMQDGIYDAFSMLQFVIRMNLSDDMRKTLEEHYEAENRRREEERRLEEEAREREVMKRIVSALAQQSAEYEKKISEVCTAYEDKLEDAEKKRLSDIQSLNEEWTAKFDGKVAEYEDKLEKQQTLHKGEIASLKAGFTHKLNETVGHYEAAIAEKDQKHEEELSAAAEQHCNEINELNSLHEKTVETINSEKAALTSDYEWKIYRINTSYENQLAETRRKYEDERESVIRAEVEAAQAVCRRTVEEAEENCRRRVDASEAKYRRADAEIGKNREKYEQKLAQKDADLAKVSAQLTDAKKTLGDCLKQIKAMDSDSRRSMEASRKREDTLRKDMERYKRSYQKNIASMSRNQEKKIEKLNGRIESLEQKLAESRKRTDVNDSQSAL